MLCKSDKPSIIIIYFNYTRHSTLDLDTPMVLGQVVRMIHSEAPRPPPMLDTLWFERRLDHACLAHHHQLGQQASAPLCPASKALT